jgi:hypothetical protein
MSQGPPPVYTGFEVKLEYPPLAFLYRFGRVYVAINGTEIQATWGAQFYPAIPGRYQLSCYTHYMFTQKAGLNDVLVDLYPGQVIRVTWTAPHLVFAKGRIQAEIIAGPGPGGGPGGG